MSAPSKILQANYSNGNAIAHVKVAVINPENFRQALFEKDVKLDTGFDAGFHISEYERAQLDLIGIKPAIGTVTLAGNVAAKAFHCLGYLQEIGNHQLPSPGIEITVIFQGSRQTGLLGLEAMNSWIVTFNGPAQSFLITR